MYYTVQDLPEIAGTRKLASWMSMLLAAVLLAACGGGAGSSGNQDGGVAAACDPNDASTFAECGTVMVALTDANGDFLNYTVDVVQLTLETANGRIVETMPQSTRVNFTDYVDMTELDPFIHLDAESNVVLEIDRVVFDGLLPADRTITFPLPADIGPGPHSVPVTSV